MMKRIYKIFSLAFLLLLVSCNVESLDGINTQRDTEEDKKDCETAFAYFKDGCFLEDEDHNFRRWGWRIGPLEEGIKEKYDIYAGAGRCEVEKGMFAGYLDITYEGNTVLVQYFAVEGYGFFETHLYVGNDIYPTKPNGQYTVAPGQYPYGGYYGDGEQYLEYEVEDISGDIYVIAHAVVCVDEKDDVN